METYEIAFYALITFVVGTISWSIYNWFKTRADNKEWRKALSVSADNLIVEMRDDVNTESDFNSIMEHARSIADIKLMKGEEIYAAYENAVSYAYKRNGTVNYAGPVVRIKIAKGLHYRAGSMKVAAPKEWLPDEDGTLVVTNKRVVFLGDRNTKTARVNKLSLEGVGRNSLELRRSSGPNWMFGLSDNSSDKAALAGFCINLDS